MAGHGRKDSDERLLLALACGASVEAAARSVGISERTVYRRLQEPGFRQRLNALRTEMVSRVSGNLIAAAGEAVRTLLALLKESQPAAVRLGAARVILECTLKYREQADLEQRLLALEARLAQGEPKD